MKLLVDTNVVLDVVLGRSPWSVDSAAILSRGRHPPVQLFLNAFALPTIYYVTRLRSKEADREAAALAAVRRAIDEFTIVPTTPEILRAALAMPAGDFEDNVQIAGAVVAGVDLIVTRNAKDFAASPIEAVAPAEALKRVAAANL